MKNPVNKQSIYQLMLKKGLLSVIGVVAMLLGGCNGSSQTTVADNNANLGSGLVVEKSATIPVLNGKTTPAGIYIRNTTGKTISDISYALAQTTSSTSLTINSGGCNTIEANSSCLLPVTTPALSVGAAGSNIVVATYNGQQSKQLINYRYLNSNNYSGVNFSDNSQTLFGSNDYATVYVFVGKGQSQNNVGFNLNNNSLAIMSGLTNGTTNIPANGVVPLEIKSNQNVTSNLVTVTPYSHTSSKNLQKALTSGVENNSQLQVAITPTKQANLLMSDLPLLTAAQADATLTIINNGNQTATISNLTSANSANVTVSPAASNACGASLNSGASCNYIISKSNNDGNGSALLTLNYNNSIGNTTTTQTAYYQNSNTAPMVAAVATQTSFSEQISTTTPITFNIINTGNVPLNTVTITPQKTTLAHTTLSIINNTCTSTIAANGNCSVQVNVAASALADSGIIYLNVSGDYSNGTTTTNYSFMSKPVTASIIDTTTPRVTSTTPQDTATSVSTSSGITVNFSEPMTSTTLTNSNIQLQKVSDSSNVSLTSQGVTSNNQTVTFSLTSGNLADNTNYRIVINPSQIQDINGNAMGAATSEIIATFKTAVDNTAPTISSFTPSNGATNQSRTPAISLTFSEAMDSSTLTSSNIKLAYEYCSGTVVVACTTRYVDGTTISYDNANYIATVNLNGTQLTSQTTYQLIVNQTNIKDVAGNALGSNASFQVSQFTVGDYTAPELSSVVPVYGATNVATNSAISLTFSESMNTATLTASNIQLLDSSNNPVTLGTPAYSNNNQTVTFQPTAALTGGASYSIVINPSAIKDVAGNAMGAAASQTVSSFSVEVSATDFMFGGQNGLVGVLSSTSSLPVELVKPSARYTAVAKAPSGIYIAVGEAGAIMLSDTSASNWVSVISGITEGLSAISCGTYTCVAVGMNGRIIYSSNNGQTWNIASSGVTSSLKSISCNGTGCLTIVGSNSNNILMLKSVDGGQTWSNVTPSGFTNGFNSVSCDTSYCVASVTGYYTGSGFESRNVFFRTTNWGGAWNVYAPTGIDTVGSGGYQGVSCSGQNCLSSIGAFGVTVYSSDGGINWIQKRDATVGVGYQLSCTASYCVAQTFGSDTILLQTTNFGTSWTTVATGASQSLAGFQCNATNCVAVGDSSIAMLSTNSGNAWSTTNQPPATSGNITRISCSEHLYCVAIGKKLTSNQHFAIMRTIDAGVSWSALDSGSVDALGDVSCFGSNCMIISATAVLHSSDSGQSWTDVTPTILAGNNLVALSCSSSTCVASGNNNDYSAPFAMRSQDQGVTWINSTSIQLIDFTSYSSGSLSCIGNICNLVGNNLAGETGVLIRSTDGGYTWSQVTIPADFYPSVISCSGSNCASLGYNLAYTNYRVMSSADSGLTWVRSNWELPSSVWLNSIACGGVSCIIAVGTTIIHSNNSGLTWENQINQAFGGWSIYTAAVY